jgi:hypothetical protein
MRRFRYRLESPSTTLLTAAGVGFTHSFDQENRGRLGAPGTGSPQT